MIHTYLIHTPKYKQRKKKRLYILSVFVLLLILAFFVYSHWTLLVFLSICSLLVYNYVSRKREDPRQYFGEPLVIGKDTLVIGDRSYNIRQLEKFKLEINDFDGQVKVVGGNDKYILNGTDNKVSFKYLNQSFNSNFYLVSESQLNEFRELFDYWYLNNIPFYEGNNGGRTYLLESLSYSEIQEFKRKYSK